MSAIWKRQRRKYHHGTHGWDLLINDVRVGCVVQCIDSYPTIYQVIVRGKHYPKTYPTMSGARMQLERLAGIETDWARDRRAKMPPPLPPLTPEELTWKILIS